MIIKPLRTGWQTKHNRFFPKNKDEFGRTIKLNAGYKIDIWESDTGDGIVIELAGGGDLAVCREAHGLRLWKPKGE